MKYHGLVHTGRVSSTCVDTVWARGLAERAFHSSQKIMENLTIDFFRDSTIAEVHRETLFSLIDLVTQALQTSSLRVTHSKPLPPGRDRTILE